MILIMQNSILILMNETPFVVILLPKVCFLSIDQILDLYSKQMALPRDIMSGRFISTIDISDMSGGFAHFPVAKNPEHFK